MHLYCEDSGIDSNLTHSSVWNNPYPLYGQMRGAPGLVRSSQRFFGECWVATRYEDVETILKNTKVFKNDISNATGESSPFQGFFVPRVVKAFARTMVFVDGLDHKRLRGLTAKAFTPARVNELEQRIGDVTRELLAEAAKEGTFDLMSSFALPLPLQIISDMLGVNEEERKSFHNKVHLVTNIPTGWDFIRRIPTFYGLYRFFKKLLNRKRKQPGDDLTSDLIRAEEDGDRLTPEELMGTVFLLLFAGHETTVNLIGNGTLALLENPEQRERVQAEPQLVPEAVEEMLRYYSPAHITNTRHVAEPFAFGTTQLDVGDKVIPLVGAANRDADVFTQAEQFDATRNPNKHLAFGAGPHFCIGAHLSRVEGRIAFQEMLSMFSSMELAVEPDTLKWRGASGGLRGLETLPVRVTL